MQYERMTASDWYLYSLSSARAFGSSASLRAARSKTSRGAPHSCIPTTTIATAWEPTGGRGRVPTTRPPTTWLSAMRLDGAVGHHRGRTHRHAGPGPFLGAGFGVSLIEGEHLQLGGEVDVAQLHLGRHGQHGGGEV